MILACMLLLAQIDTRSLLAEMNDLDRLTRPADYRCVQYSSYDRGSHDRGNWFANDDCGKYLRVENGEHVLAECDGPGAIVRIWSANPSGIVRLYLDGALALEADFRALLAGEVPNFLPPLGEFTSRGGNLYYPFAFAKSMKLATLEGGQYYQVDVRQYPKETAITTWSQGSAPQPKDLVPLISGFARGAPDCKRIDAKAIDGEAGTIRRLEIDLPADPNALRAEMLHIDVDGERCVSCPLGDFFGTAPGRTSYSTLPLGITSDGVGYCNFPMPFSKSIHVETSRPVRLWVDRPSGELRFHAFWRGDNHLETRPMRDWNVLNARGKGRYVGTALYVRNPVKGWWGEGDEKVYVDGEKFPSIFGTGTEDYFGYAWCDPTPFQSPYHSQSRCDGPGNRGFTALNRFHVLDDIPFSNSLRFDLEVWHWVDCEMGYATIAYWYAEPGSAHDFAEPFLDDREIIAMPEPKGVAGAIEGEKMKIAAKTGGNPQAQDLDGIAEGASRDGHLWWRDAKVGDQLTLEFDSPREADRLFIRLTKAPDYAIVKIELNDQPYWTNVDLYADKVVLDDERKFDGIVHAGANTLTITIVGTSEKAHPKSYMFGLDYVRVP